MDIEDDECEQLNLVFKRPIPCLAAAGNPYGSNDTFTAGSQYSRAIVHRWSDRRPDTTFI